MTIVKHELRQGKTAFIIWTSAISALLAICVFLYPEMKGQMDGINDLFASMGSFTEAFGMDKLNFGTLIGYYAIECGNVLGLGGAFFAALLGCAILCKEEKDGTAEFLLTHPVSRRQIVTEKLAAAMIQIIALNIIVYLITLISIAMVGETVPWLEINLLHVAYLLLGIEIVCLCFGVSAFLRRGGAGIGIGIAIMAYFLNLVANISESAEFLKYVTPFGYCDGANIVESGSLEPVPIIIGAILSAIGVATAYIRYSRKDIA